MYTNQHLQTILEQLVRIPSVTGDMSKAEAVIRCVSQLLKPTSVQQLQGKIGGFPYLQATTCEPNSDMLWFVMHLDVVPADSTMFAVTKDSKNYYGRGVFDMKGMAAAVLAAFTSLSNLTNKNVGLLFTTDEETGGKNGVGALVANTFKAGAVFVFDQSADWVLEEKMKGILWLKVTATGQAAHGARPWLGQSANHAMVNYLADLKAWYDKTMPTTDPDNYYTTFNVGTLHGGQATNQVNDETTATIDVRFVSETDAQKVTRAARSLAKKYKNVSVVELMHESCVNTDTKEYWFKRTKQCMQDLRIQPGPNGERFGHGSTDGRFFAPFNIPVITTRPPGGGQHGPNEWVSKKGLQQLEELCHSLMTLSRA